MIWFYYVASVYVESNYLFHLICFSFWLKIGSSRHFDPFVTVICYATALEFLVPYLFVVDHNNVSSYMFVVITNSRFACSLTYFMCIIIMYLVTCFSFLDNKLVVESILTFLALLCPTLQLSNSLFHTCLLKRHVSSYTFVMNSDKIWM